MKKIIALTAVCGFALAFVACGKKADTEASNVDTTVVVEPTPVVADTTVVDTAATHADTTVAPAH
jgi:flagellar basal body-associated protein FliL